MVCFKFTTRDRLKVVQLFIRDERSTTWSGFTPGISDMVLHCPAQFSIAYNPCTWTGM